uniref:Uncharacterized protein n=1 Tax=Eutreptiella gymnastica TaxID=73025 RepID=A0A7S1HTI7_9EUGL|mmetsp:Transcript_104677/g.180479  ORF Transcript_104677/g.180479 Transcript_104677/m.180479 type:complete len:128 (+) Transcript_104677:269-652(+)
MVPTAGRETLDTSGFELQPQGLLPQVGPGVQSGTYCLVPAKEFANCTLTALVCLPATRALLLGPKELRMNPHGYCFPSWREDPQAVASTLVPLDRRFNPWSPTHTSVCSRLAAQHMTDIPSFASGCQ